MGTPLPYLMPAIMERMPDTFAFDAKQNIFVTDLVRMGCMLIMRR